MVKQGYYVASVNSNNINITSRVLENIGLGIVTSAWFGFDNE